MSTLPKYKLAKYPTATSNTKNTAIKSQVFQIFELL